MPVVKIKKDRLEELVGKETKEVLEKIPMLGADIEREQKNEVDIEFFPNRPDLFSAEGVARAMRGYLGIEKGLPSYEQKKSNIDLNVDGSVKNVRPKISAAVVKNLDLKENDVTSLVNLQEHLHWGLGRNRKKVSIGIHDLEKIEPPLTYKAVKPKEIEFVPLGYKEKMNLEQILEQHKKGQKFGHIIRGKEKYPIIQDKNEQILSFPPIINGVLTEVNESTKNIFIDVTGTEQKSVEKALNIIATSLAEIDGKIFSVTKKGLEKEKTPRLDPSTKKITKKEIKELIGSSISKKETIDSLEKMRYGVKDKGDKFKVEVPAYRADILHKWDVIEDVAIGYGYDKIDPEIPNIGGIGKTHPVEELGREVREIMTGLGYQEVMTLTLTNKNEEFDKVNRKRQNTVTIQNPITEEHTIFRTSILPSLLSILEINQHRDLPQRVFEFGEVEHLTERFAKDCYHLAGVSLHSKAGFTEAKAIIDSIFREFDADPEFEKSDDDLLLKGRRGDIFIGDEKIGVFGEICPDVIKRYDLGHPCVGFEIEVEKIFRND